MASGSGPRIGLSLAGLSNEYLTTTTATSVPGDNLSDVLHSFTTRVKGGKGFVEPIAMVFGVVMVVYGITGRH